MTAFEILLIMAASLVAGFVDSIAGGGGLITLPIYTIILDTPPLAVGTNKIGATLAAVVALLVYSRKGHFRLRDSALFAVFVSLGSFLGTRLNPWIPEDIFKWVLAGICPLILLVVWKKDLWAKAEARGLRSHPRIVISGLACGLYDGLWGPGSGTFMFLALLFYAKLPIISALAASKLANAASAFVALSSYALEGYVKWQPGSLGGLGIIVGSFVGATLATKKSMGIVRPILAAVAVILMVSLVLDT